MMDVTEWLRTLDLDRYASVFIENEVDLQTLQILTDNDLKELGLPFGPRKRVLSAIAEMKSAEMVRPREASERRQLTVLFCDMVGFTELAHRVDPEVLERIIRVYEDACAACIARYDGFLFQRLGDGIVAFFGFPLAHESEAERAVRAGLGGVARPRRRVDVHRRAAVAAHPDVAPARDGRCRRSLRLPQRPARSCLVRAAPRR